MGRIGIDDLEALQTLKLDLSEQDELFVAQTECTFVFSNAEGWPSGVIMSFVRADGAFWLTAVEGRAHVKALAGEPRVTLVVTNAGTGSPGRQMWRSAGSPPFTVTGPPSSGSSRSSRRECSRPTPQRSHGCSTVRSASSSRCDPSPSR